MSKKSNSYNFMLEDYFLILLGHLSLHRFVLCPFIDCNYHSEGYEKMLMEYWESDMKSQAYNNVFIKKRQWSLYKA